MSSANSISRQAKKLRFITATSLFDGHDVSINIIRRLLQQSGVEVIHLGHNKSVEEIVWAAVQEGAHGIAVSSYQGGHIEYFKYMRDILKKNGLSHIRIFAGGGGVIIPEETKELEDYGIAKVYSPEDGQRMGLQGIIDDMIKKTQDSESPPLPQDWKHRLQNRDIIVVARLISRVCGEFSEIPFLPIEEELKTVAKQVPVVGITGTGGSGKSSLEDEFIRRFLDFYRDKKIAILAIDPTRKKTGGALLGDRIRMNFLDKDRVFMRSFATREPEGDISSTIQKSIPILKAAGYDLIIVETAGIGQGDIGVTRYSEFSIYVMTSDFGAPTQLEKIDMLDYADMVVINKFDHKNSLDTLRDVRKQYRRNHNLFQCSDEELPVVGTVASNFMDPGLDSFFARVVGSLKQKRLIDWPVPDIKSHSYQNSSRCGIISTDREHYLGEIARTIKEYHAKTEDNIAKVQKLESLQTASHECNTPEIAKVIEKAKSEIDPELETILKKWEEVKQSYSRDEIVTMVRNNEIRTQLVEESLSGLKIPKIALPDYRNKGDLLNFLRKENLPGYFPYTAGVFPFRRVGEDPKRQFAGEGSPERTNKRFHYLCRHEEAKRLSTAFDSVTLYGEDPSERPDIFGKIGESGVSISTLDDMNMLYKDFDLCSPNTSVSMTINGPAPIMLAFFFNAAIDQQIEKFARDNKREPFLDERKKIEKKVLENVRGTVQADILKEDQGQNSCIFSTFFALKMMGDIQEFFIKNNVRNFYSVSISGYHIAEAGANPVTQLALTLSNAFTYVEYYLGRGMKVDEFAPNLSFFFSSGMEPEYNVLIRVARRIWAIAMKYRYGGDERSQKLKCHIQTSGRSLHAQEMQFNDIRTTLQALMALDDNCNSLHTNSYDEAVTTPTEESVRRAMAIQLIINKEFGLFKNQNPLQGSFIMEKLTDMVEEAVLKEFEMISQRGGVLGAMEFHYQRGKIQDESLVYEHKKHSGEYPIVGVNTYINQECLSEDYRRPPTKLSRASYEEKMLQIANLRKFQEKNKDKAKEALASLRDVAISGKNVFEELMKTVRYASIGQITQVLYESGGKYRRNM